MARMYLARGTTGFWVPTGDLDALYYLTEEAARRLAELGQGPSGGGKDLEEGASRGWWPPALEETPPALVEKILARARDSCTREVVKAMLSEWELTIPLDDRLVDYWVMRLNVFMNLVEGLSNGALRIDDPFFYLQWVNESKPWQA